MKSFIEECSQFQNDRPVVTPFQSYLSDSSCILIMNCIRYIQLYLYSTMMKNNRTVSVCYSYLFPQVDELLRSCNSNKLMVEIIIYYLYVRKSFISTFCSANLFSLNCLLLRKTWPFQRDRERTDFDGKEYIRWNRPSHSTNVSHASSFSRHVSCFLLWICIFDPPLPLSSYVKKRYSITNECRLICLRGKTQLFNQSSLSSIDTNWSRKSSSILNALMLDTAIFLHIQMNIFWQGGDRTFIWKGGGRTNHLIVSKKSVRSRDLSSRGYDRLSSEAELTSAKSSEGASAQHTHTKK